MSEDVKHRNCADKIAYESSEEAQAAIASNSFYYRKPKLSVYRCDTCGLFHVTRSHDDS